MRRALIVALVVLGGCLATDIDHAVEDVVALHLLPSGGVEACAQYTHEHDELTECCGFENRYRVIDVDARGGLADSDRACSGNSGGQAAMLGEAPLSDGGKLVFADSNLTRVDAGGATVWTVPSPFGHISAASEDRDGYLYLARGPQVARVALADGSVAWISELR